MPENIVLMEMAGIVSPVERSVISATFFCHLLTAHSPREGNAQIDGSQQHSMPLGVALTGYRLLTTTLILGIGIPKAILSYRGQSLISPTLDWVGGIIVALL